MTKMESLERLSPEAEAIYKQIGQERYDRLISDMRHIAAKFKERQQWHQAKLHDPTTPTTNDLKRLDQEVEELQQSKKLIMDDFSEVDPYAGLSKFKYFMKKYILLPSAIHPQSRLMNFMVLLQTCAFLYNAWVIPLRFCFHVYQTVENRYWWLICDYSIDAIYIFDTLIIKPRMMFLDHAGIYEKGRRLTMKNFVVNGTFKVDLASLLPLELFYLVTGINGKIPRLLRYYHFEDLFERLDSNLPYPMTIRLSRTVNIMIYLIHLSGCAYYTFSDYKGIGSTPFLYDGEGSAYAVCFYVGLKTAVSIGKNPKPGRAEADEMVFMGILWLMGVFVFAVLIGNVKEIIAQATASQDEYMFRFDMLSQYMFRMNVPDETVNRVKEWCQHTWKTQKSFDELAILEFLPSKMRTDVALDVHYKTISKVNLFHGCDPGLLKSLVVSLRPMLFLPGDYICKKGDVGKEMFIITTGAVQVVGGPNDSIVFVTLGEGVCFGEIALLGTGGMNRRTANVRAHGFTTLYVLFKEDLVDALRDYPEDKALLAKKAQKAAKEVVAKQAANATVKTKMTRDVIFPLPGKDPMLFSLLLKMMPKEPKKAKLYPQISLDTLAKKEDIDQENDDILIVEKIEK